MLSGEGGSPEISFRLMKCEMYIPDLNGDVNHTVVYTGVEAGGEVQAVGMNLEPPEYGLYTKP